MIIKNEIVVIVYNNKNIRFEMYQNGYFCLL